jgi:hypothetical protein
VCWVRDDLGSSQRSSWILHWNLNVAFHVPDDVLPIDRMYGRTGMRSDDARIRDLSAAADDLGLTRHARENI